ncbi:MAG: ABC transporter ATP-binding protein [Clostridiales bacterium]|nr:ABC transporter ATP-binding protein [Clostridiales bacterium]
MLKLFKKFSKKDVLFIIISIIMIIAQVYLDLKTPDYMSEITQLVKTQGSQMSDIWKNGSMMLVCSLGSLILTVITGYLVANVAANLSKNIRKEIFEKVESLGLHEVKEFSTSSLITRTTNDISQIQSFVAMGLQVLVKAPITAIWGIRKILNKGWEWSAATGIAVLVLLIAVALIVVFVLPKFKKIQKLTDKLNGKARENITGIRVVRAFNASKYQEEKFDAVNAELTDTQLFNQKSFAVMQPLMYIVMYLLTLSIYLIGIKLINDALLTDRIAIFGNMVVFSSYAMQIIMSFLMLVMIFIMLPRAEVSASRIKEVLETKDSIKDGNKGTSDVTEKGTVEFRDVSFKYPDASEYLLEKISFKANKGETVAFIGSTGSGKSTLVNLIPRFYDATEGEVLVDGQNVKDYTQAELRNRMSYIPQKAMLFDGTVKSNIVYGDNGKSKITQDKIEEALKVAQGEEFVLKMDGKYDATISQGGTNISGGQKQRLSIARAIARNPEIYIFDDSFSALDYKTDKILRKALKEYTKDATTLIVAQRIGTIMHADKIIVLDNGKCVGIGTHKELLKNCEVYKEIALSQLTKEELENA